VSGATVLIVGETGRASGSCRQDPECWNDQRDMATVSHLGTSNFLFADEHVKALHVSATGTPLNMWNASNTTNNGDVTTGPASATLQGYLNTDQAGMS